MLLMVLMSGLPSTNIVVGSLPENYYRVDPMLNILSTVGIKHAVQHQKAQHLEHLYVPISYIESG